MTAIRTTGSGETWAQRVSTMDSGRMRAYRENLAFYQGQQ